LGWQYQLNDILFNLLMQNPATNNTFSRASLDMSYSLLRKKEPQLALTIRNILFQKPLDKNSNQADNKNTDVFTVSLDTFQVRKIVETLMLILNESSTTHTHDTTSLFRPVLIQSIINEWTVLAKNMFDEYQQNKD